MNLSNHHRVAIVGATVTSAIALYDAMTHGITGDYSVFSDDSTVPALRRLGDLVHGVTYLALAGVLYAERDRLRSANRVTRVVATVVVGSLALLAFGFLVAIPVHEAFGGPEMVVGIAAGVGFLGMLLGSMVLGFALLRTPGMRTSSRLLGAMLPVLGATVLLQLVLPDFAHPAYLETAAHFGLALIGADAVRSGIRRPDSRAHQSA
jgi:hypothetical protein